MVRGTPCRGILAGTVGTLVLSGFELLEHAWLRRPAVYAPASVATGLASRLVGLSLGDVAAAQFGLLLRWLYGPALGAVYAAVRPSLPASMPAAGASFGAGIYLFELLAMPALGATPPPGSWRRRELATLAAHTVAFGAATAAAFELLNRFARPRRRPAPRQLPKR